MCNIAELLTGGALMLWGERGRVGLTAALGLSLVLALCTRDAFAYTDAGDRLFPATILLPQISLGGEFYTNLIPLPQPPGGVATPNRNPPFSEVYAKTITGR